MQPEELVGQYYRLQMAESQHFSCFHAATLTTGQEPKTMPVKQPQVWQQIYTKALYYW